MQEVADPASSIFSYNSSIDYMIPDFRDRVIVSTSMQMRVIVDR